MAFSGRFGMLPAALTRCEAIGLDEIGVLAVMSTYADREGHCRVSQSTVARILKRSRPWVIKTLNSLEELRLVERTQVFDPRTGARRACAYRLRFDLLPGASETHPESRSADGMGDDDHAGVRACFPLSRSVTGTVTGVTRFRRLQNKLDSLPTRDEGGQPARQVPADWCPSDGRSGLGVRNSSLARHRSADPAVHRRQHQQGIPLPGLFGRLAKLGRKPSELGERGMTFGSRRHEPLPPEPARIDQDRIDPGRTVPAPSLPQATSARRALALSASWHDEPSPHLPAEVVQALESELPKVISDARAALEPGDPAEVVAALAETGGPPRFRLAGPVSLDLDVEIMAAWPRDLFRKAFRCVWESFGYRRLPEPADFLRHIQSDLDERRQTLARLESMRVRVETARARVGMLRPGTAKRRRRGSIRLCASPT